MNDIGGEFVTSSSRDLKIDQNLKRNNVKSDFVSSNRRDLKIDEILGIPRNQETFLNSLPVGIPRRTLTAGTRYFVT
jgi:hypothetical protein